MPPQTQKTDAPAFVTVACKLPHGLKITVGERSIALRGANAPDAVVGFGLTTVPEDFWSEWSKLYRNYEPLKKGLIFAHAKADDTRAEAGEKKDLKTGLEQLDPKNIVSGIKPDEQMKQSAAAGVGAPVSFEDEQEAA